MKLLLLVRMTRRCGWLAPPSTRPGLCWPPLTPATSPAPSWPASQTSGGADINIVYLARLQCCAGRCVEADTGRAPATDPGCGAGRCQEARRGLCAIPPRREDRRPAPCPAHGERLMVLLAGLITSPLDHDRRLARGQPQHRGQSPVSWWSAWRGQLYIYIHYVSIISTLYYS